MEREFVPTGATYSDSDGPTWEKRTIRSHLHNELEISVILEGGGTFQCGNYMKTVKEGSVCWIAPSFAHTFERSSYLMRFSTIHTSVLPLHLQQLFPAAARIKGAHIAQLSKAGIREFESTILTCARLEESAVSHPLKDHLRDSSLNILITLLSQSDPKNSSALLSVADVAAMIKESVCEAWEIETLAKLTGTSISHFRRLFKEIYGISPKQFQQNCRMEVALQLLMKSSKSMDQIASAIGFESLSSFSYWFRKLQTMSPTEWRETYAEKMQSKLSK